MNCFDYTKMDPEGLDVVSQIARTLVCHACGVQTGERVYVESIDAPQSLVIAVMNEVRARGAMPIVQLKSIDVLNQAANAYDREEVELLANLELQQMQLCDSFIGLRSPEPEQVAMTSQAKALILKYFVEPVHYRHRNQHMKWVYFRWPSPLMAARAGMPLDEFRAYYLRSLWVDYLVLEQKMQALASLLDQTQQVRITHPNGTDLRMRLAHFGTYISAGRKNVPDGEVFTAPTRECVEGIIRFNIDSWYYGETFRDVTLRFEQGQVVEASSRDNTEALNQLLDTDPGARHVGEVALGLNPLINRPILDILFDEKMQGSLHLALGNAYPVADNGNRSAIHWDLILAQNPEYGGGDLYFDRVLVRRDGRFVLPALIPLNPEFLLPALTSSSTHTLTWNETSKL